MKNIVIVLSIIWGIQANSQNFRIEGKVANPYQGKLYLHYANVLDSVEVENQYFVFEGKVDYPIKATISTSKSNRATGFLILENSRLTAEIIVENQKNIHFKSLKGSESVEILKDFILFKNKNQQNPYYNELLSARLAKMIRSNPQSQIWGMLLSQIASDKVLTLSQMQNLLKVIDVKTQSSEDIQRMEVALEVLEKTQIGAVFPDIEFADESGKNTSLQSHLGSYTLVLFSSSECISCIEFDRKLKDVFTQYKKKGFRLYEVFLEQNSEVWLSYLYREKIAWKSVIALGKYHNPVLKSLGITSVPTNFLLDAQGRIVQINVGVKKLSYLLEEFYKGK